MNLATMRAQVYTYLQRRPDLLADIDGALNDALRMLAVGSFVDQRGLLRKLHFPELEMVADTALVLDQEGYTLPAPGYAPLAVQYQHNTEQWPRLDYKTPESFAMLPIRSGQPYAFTFYENEIKIRNVPDATWAGAALRMWYYRLPDAMTAEGDEPEINEVWHPLIVLLAAADVASRYGMTDVAAWLEQKFMVELTKRRLPSEVSGTVRPARVL